MGIRPKLSEIKKGEIMAPPELPSASGCRRGRRGAVARRAGISASLVQVWVLLTSDTARGGDRHRPSLAVVCVSAWASRPGEKMKMLCHTAVRSHELMAQLVSQAQSWPQPLILAACCCHPCRPRLASRSLWLFPEGEPEVLDEFLCSFINIANCHSHFLRGTKETNLTPKQTLLDFFQATMPSLWDREVERQSSSGRNSHFLMLLTWPGVQERMRYSGSKNNL